MFCLLRAFDYGEISKFLSFLRISCLNIIYAGMGWLPVLQVVDELFYSVFIAFQDDFYRGIALVSDIPKKPT